MKRCRIKFLFLDVLRGVERVQGADNHLFRHRTGEQAHGRLPVILMHANRFEDRRDDAADRGEGRIVDVICCLTAEGEAVQRAQENADDDNHLTGAQHKPFQALPGLDHQAFQVWNVIDRQLHDKR